MFVPFAWCLAPASLLMSLSWSSMNGPQLSTTSPIHSTPAVPSLIHLASGHSAPILSAPIAASILMLRESAFMQNRLSSMKGSPSPSSLSFKISSYTASSRLLISHMHPILRLPPLGKSLINKPLTRSSHPAARNAAQRICSRYSPRREKSQFLEGQKSLAVFNSLSPSSYLTATERPFGFARPCEGLPFTLS
ncbi:hypothetical protein SISSUDRAFT_535172 [Sistotremastrum suecicum HHB10207 ss-3]|uniref:Secreted protein n=1 Tax=Sistotremastrum suecicum HHB10207 ss-3 TaxID=1314776 RepID=A0A165XS17_9AGAM|nr:hypothetical protein SISSUDRAFT_535172 [Sistotremastrum suecicum HHB10207 ss-3]